MTRRYGSKQPSRAYWRAMMLMTWTANPDGFDAETWARRTGLSVEQVREQTSGRAA